MYANFKPATSFTNHKLYIKGFPQFIEVHQTPVKLQMQLSKFICEETAFQT